jgi:hypothetical protein
MEMKYSFDGVNTRILVYSLKGNSFTGDVINVNGELITLAMATSEGVPVAAKELPTEFTLEQNYPNPFNPVTEIHYSIPTATDVKLEIYNVMGQKVATLVNSHLEAGYHTAVWDGSYVASGVYFYRLKADSFVQSRKMMLLK